VVTRGPSLEEWRRGIQTHNDSRKEYDQLVRALGRLHADLFLDVVADSSVLRGRGSLDGLPPKSMAGFMKREVETFLARKQYIDSLVWRTTSRHLGNLLNTSIRDEKDYYKDRLIAGLDGRELAIDQAANWICSADKGKWRHLIPSTRLLLVDYIPVNPGDGGVMGRALGPTDQHLRVLHRAITPDATLYRFSRIASPYPSSVGGNKLLGYMFQLTSGLNWPNFGDPRWDSFAMFYLTAIAHAQGFADGNKRIAHLAYAIVLIKNTHDFKAPSEALERWLVRMNE
jgi:hypothetical protein